MKIQLPPNPQLAEKLAASMSYQAYLTLVDELVALGQTSGPKQSESLVRYTMLNARRMRRLGKTLRLTEPLQSQLQQGTREQIWLVITESWCGDAAQSLPLFHLIASQTARITLRVILRDEHPELIDQYLTHGARSIPKLIAIDAQTGQELGTWGPRPFPAQQMLLAYKANPKVPYSIFNEQLQRWYNQDKSQTLQEELLRQLLVWDLVD